MVGSVGPLYYLPRQCNSFIFERAHFQVYETSEQQYPAEKPYQTRRQEYQRLSDDHQRHAWGKVGPRIGLTIVTRVSGSLRQSGRQIEKQKERSFGAA